MRQLMFLRYRKLAWRELAEPQLVSPTDVLVRPLAVARCDLDYLFLRYPVSRAMQMGAALHVLDPQLREAFGSPPFGGPFPYGHECVAEVVACGDDVKRVSVGDRVVVPFQVACGACGRCGRGLSSRCETAKGPLNTYGFGDASGGWGGVLCDLVRVPFADFMLFKAPAGVDSTALASAGDNVPDAYRAVAAPLRDRPGAPVGIFGGRSRSVGLYAAALAKALGSEQVDYIDHNQERLGIAQSLGVNPVEIRRSDSAPCPVRYPIVVDATVSLKGLQRAIRSVEVGGVCTSTSIYMTNLTGVPLLQMYFDGIRLKTGLANVHQDLPEVLELFARGFDPSPIHNVVASWDDAPEALLEARTKVIITRA